MVVVVVVVEVVVVVVVVVVDHSKDEQFADHRSPITQKIHTYKCVYACSVCCVCLVSPLRSQNRLGSDPRISRCGATSQSQTSGES